MLGKEFTQAVLDDYKTADIDDAQKALFSLLKKLSLNPESVTAEDTQQPETLGMSHQAVQDAVHVCILFNIIVRIADALDFAIPTEETFAKMGKMVLKHGYKF